MWCASLILASTLQLRSRPVRRTRYWLPVSHTYIGNLPLLISSVCHFTISLCLFRSLPVPLPHSISMTISDFTACLGSAVPLAYRSITVCRPSQVVEKFLFDDAAKFKSKRVEVDHLGLSSVEIWCQIFRSIVEPIPQIRSSPQDQPFSFLQSTLTMPKGTIDTILGDGACFLPRMQGSEAYRGEFL